MESDSLRPTAPRAAKGLWTESLPAHWLALALAFACAVLWTGCQSPSASSTAPLRPFDVRRDVFSFPNELKWSYGLDPATGKQVSRANDPPPEYSHRCFVLTRAARQFFYHATFDPTLPPDPPSADRERVREILHRSPRAPSPPEERVRIPGFENLYDFSRAREDLLKAECGGAWRSYVQWGHWRMVFPFSRSSQAAAAERLIEELAQNRPPIAHVVRFPDLSINHAILIGSSQRAEFGVEFLAYDPNSPGTPLPLRFDSEERTFFLPPTSYFIGGPVDVYEVYRGWLY